MTTMSRRKAAIIAAALVLAIVGLVALFHSGSGGDTMPTADASWTPPPVADLPTYTNTTAPHIAPGTPGGKVVNGQVIWAPGLSGLQYSKDAPRHTAVIKAWSTKPLPVMGWIAPTANSSGKSSFKTAAFEKTLTVWGWPKYTEIYVQAGVDGTPVHCEISIDGKVVSSATSKNPYGVIFCIG